MFRNVLTLCFFLSSAAARSQHLARSLLNVTDYLSNLNDPGAVAASNVNGRPGVEAAFEYGTPFLKTSKLICDVNAAKEDTGAPKFVHMVVGDLGNVEMLPSYAYAMRVDYDATGALGPAAKVLMDQWNGKFGGRLQASLDQIPDAVSAKEESMANQGKSHILLGKAYTAPNIDPSRVIFTGGTSENIDVVSSGGIYFSHMNYAYKAIMQEAKKAGSSGSTPHSLVMPVLAGGSTYNPKYVIDKDVLVFFAANVMTHDLMKYDSNINDIYLVLPDEPDNVMAMCKYCQYRTLTPIADIGKGLCTLAREQSGASIVSMLFVMLAAAWW